MPFRQHNAGNYVKRKGAEHGLGHDPEEFHEVIGAEHPGHGDHSGEHYKFGGDGEDMDHLYGEPDMHETEGKLAALKAIGMHARKAMAMTLREKMPKTPEPEHSPQDADGAEMHRSILGDEDKSRADKLRALMAKHRG